MLTFIVICVLLYLGYRILRWAFSNNRSRAGRGGDSFFDSFDFGGSDGGGDSGGGGSD